MKEHVCFQLVGLNETLPAHLTFEGPLARVDVHVSLQVLRQGEASTARLTGKHLPSVDRLVRPERSSLYKNLAAHRAFVRVLSSVDASVTLKGEGVFEALSTLGAFVRLLSRVHELVGF